MCLQSPVMAVRDCNFPSWLPCWLVRDETAWYSLTDWLTVNLTRDLDTELNLKVKLVTNKSTQSRTLSVCLAVTLVLDLLTPKANPSALRTWAVCVWSFVSLGQEDLSYPRKCSIDVVSASIAATAEDRNRPYTIWSTFFCQWLLNRILSDNSHCCWPVGVSLVSCSWACYMLWAASTNTPAAVPVYCQFACGRRRPKRLINGSTDGLAIGPNWHGRPVRHSLYTVISYSSHLQPTISCVCRRESRSATGRQSHAVDIVCTVVSLTKV